MRSRSNSKPSRRNARVAALASAAFAFAGALEGRASAGLRLASGDLSASRPIAATFVFDGAGCHGKNLSPELHWSGVPRGTREFAVTMVDPDAPAARPFVHWTLFHVGAERRALGRGAAPAGAVAGATDWGPSRYGGPCPPPGETHRYVVRLDALDTVVPAGASTTEAAYERLRAGHVLESATLISRYSR